MRRAVDHLIEHLKFLTQGIREECSRVSETSQPTHPAVEACPTAELGGLPEAVALREGYFVCLRAVSLEDGEPLRQMFSRLSRESIYQRFHLPYPSVPEWAVALFAGVHGAGGNFVVATAGNEIVGHAMYASSEDGRSADIGIIVEDEWQRRGIGKLLLSRLASAAGHQRIEAFTGVVLGENRAMMGLVTAVFTGVRSTPRGGQYEIYAPLAGIIEEESELPPGHR
jgi:RimJ/RimL family protein N-acetyltransferase